LNRLLHELHILLIETSASVTRLDCLKALDLFCVVVSRCVLVLLLALALFLLTNAAHFDLGAGLFLFGSVILLGRDIIIISHELASLFVESSVTATLLNLEVAFRLLHLASILVIIVILLLGIIANNLLFMAFVFLVFFLSAGGFNFTLARSFSIVLLTLTAVCIFLLLAKLLFFFCFTCSHLFLLALLFFLFLFD
jgi:hypothetical protein